MRILNFELERFGHFTGKKLVFRPDARLHIIYGDNEAGKTSSLDAIGDLLFGFGLRTQYDFLHDRTKLSLGATIASKDGRQLSFKRRKGTKNTLLDQQGNPLVDDALLPYLGLVSRQVFSNAFGLSKESLRAGAEEMLKSGGEAGSSLFAAASGLKGLTELRRRLENEASAIFAPTRAQHRTFYQAKDRYDEAARQIRQLEVKDRDLKDRTAKISLLNEQLGTVRKQRFLDIQRREFLIRQREIGPLLHTIAADEDLLKTFEHLPSVEPSRVLQLRAALNALESTQSELDRLRNEETGAEASANSFVIDAPLLALGPAIQLLVSETGNYAAEKAQLPRVQSEADGFRKRLDELRVKLGLPEGTDIAETRPSDLLILRVKEQVSAGRTLAAKLASNLETLRKEQTNHENLLNQQTGQNSARDPKALRERLSRLMPAMGQISEMKRVERSTTRDTEQLKERAAQLSPPVSNLDALALLSLPTEETIDDFAEARSILEKELSTLRASLDEIVRNLPTLQSQANQLGEGHLDATPKKIAEARADRRNHWRPLRSILLKEIETPAVGELATRIIDFERGVEMADRLSDDAVVNADRIASYASALKRLSEDREKQASLAEQVQGKQQEITDHEQKWRDLWQLFGFQPLVPRRMSGWLTQVSELIERRSENCGELHDFAAIRVAIDEARPALIEIGKLLGILEGEKLPVDLLLEAVDGELERRGEAWRNSCDLTTRIEDCYQRVEALDAERRQLLAEERDWKTIWSQLLVSINLPPDTTTEGATAALEVWQQVPATLNQCDDRTRRITGMTRDMRDFEQRTSALLVQLSELDLGIGADAAIKNVALRLGKAQQVEAKATVAKDRLKNIQSQMTAAEGSVRTATEAFELLCSDLPTSTHRAEQVADLETREKILQSLSGKRQTLVPLSRGQSESDLHKALESFDETAAIAEIEELKRKDNQYNQQENDVYANLRQAENDLLAIQNGVGAEIALQLRRNAETELVVRAHDWAVKKFGQILLSHAIEQHRSYQEQPLLRRASELFSLLTAGSFSGIDQEFDENDDLRLVGRRDAERTAPISAMSEGTRDQLYLALRLASLEEFARKSEPVPFIGDDLLANFDDERTQQGLSALAATGDQFQPILFTHHHRVVELALVELGTAVDVIDLT